MIARLRCLNKGRGEPSTPEDLYNEFRSRQDQKLLKYASVDSEVARLQLSSVLPELAVEANYGPVPR